MNTKRNLLVLVFVLGLFVLSACGLIDQNESEGTPSFAPSSDVDEWYDEDGHAVKGDESTIRYVDWLWDFISDEYPNATLKDMNGWYQSYIPSLEVTVSWSEWPETKLGDVDGVYTGKALFIAQRDIEEWVPNADAEHKACVGTFIPSYSDSMSTWNVTPSTIVQFDGNLSDVRQFISKMDAGWYKVRYDLNGCSR